MGNPVSVREEGVRCYVAHASKLSEMYVDLARNATGLWSKPLQGRQEGRLTLRSFDKRLAGQAPSLFNFPF